MNTDQRLDLRRGEETKLMLKAETEKILGFAFEVLNEVGHGLNSLIRVHPCPSVVNLKFS